MKKIPVMISLSLSLVLLLTACGSNTTTTPTAPTPAADTVIAAGHLVPNRSVYLTFLASGRVEEVLVKTGEKVTEGQVLVRLGDREQVTAALAGAQAQVSAADKQIGNDPPCSAREIRGFAADLRKRLDAMAR